MGEELLFCFILSLVAKDTLEHTILQVLVPDWFLHEHVLARVCFLLRTIDILKVGGVYLESFLFFL